MFSYLLKNLEIDRPNQVRADDITFLPMARGFVYLVVILDWATRKMLAWQLSNTMTANFCVDALEAALIRCDKSEIFNTDQHSQFTRLKFTPILKVNDTQISMDGKVCWCDNVFVEHLWTTIKYEEVSLRANCSD